MQETPGAPLNARERRKADTRQEIIEAGIKVFREKGYDGASVGMITKEAQVSRATFYRHFTDLAELSIEIGTYPLPDVYAALRAMARATTQAELRAGVDAAVDAFRRKSTYLAVGFRASVSSARFLEEDVLIRERCIAIFAEETQQRPQPERALAELRIAMLVDQLLYVCYEFLVRGRQASVADLTDALTSFWAAELLLRRPVPLS
ncbi:MAG: TetR/AcrR family transcriptional regulator [Propionicimonas sp.]|uniref:TetR/AcrR family transcriptional regulator n=1 Tax=Propionicimonas sp. TaxID=1955623 RepID=UPI002B1FA4C6|nr:TetR/AcrR family transcriptional regulator [Propionicimonas sp.]MEA4945685.1 TetR/AcrR family transcriptional regulator [Propionicimonas sp.]MEA5118933.1 TetR/AcrR family transcriptional regulator [Propionicimonas sp.]